MKLWKKITIVCSVSFFMMASLFTSSLAWFTLGNRASLPEGNGYTASSYFASGDGSEANPYVINKPIHLYNLAWLQYFGLFNKTTTDEATGKLVYKQTYFTLGADLDMTPTSSDDWTLPPIGTSTYPFIGSFNGANYIISHLKVDNVLGTGGITKKPASVPDGSILSGVNIVGTFGVVGNYQDVLHLGTGNYTYSSSVNTVKNVYLDDVSVKSSLDQTLIGVAVGYVNAAISGVGVSNSRLTLSNAASALDSTNLTSNLSDYSTVGYATSSYWKSRNTTEVTFTNSALANYSFTAQQQGDLNGWGGSIEMDKLYSRLDYFRNAATSMSYTMSQTVTVPVSGSSSTSITGTGYFRQYYDESVTGGSSDTRLKGSYSFSAYNEADGTATSTTNPDYYNITTPYIYLSGRNQYQTSVTTNTTVSLGGYWISYSGYYLTRSGTGVTSATSTSSASVWAFSNYSGSGTISTVVSGTTYYLNGTPSSSSRTGTLSVSTSASTTWTKSGSTLSFSSGGYTWYLRYSGGFILYRGTSTSFTFTAATSTTTSNSSVYSGVTSKDTYFPLNVDSTYYPKDSNTGYIVSGSSYQNPASSQGYPYRSGDVRVSQYSFSNLSNSFYNLSSYDPAYFELLTRTATSDGLKRISDSNNSANTSSTYTSPSMENYTKVSVASLGLKKYNDSLAAFGKLLAASSNIYGLHFMNSQISKENLATADVARIKKAGTEVTDYTNYQMPRDSIDFNLRKRGYINFFGGTYFTGNDSFFSLHHITRNSDQSIANIKEISSIYSNGVKTDPYVYGYSDGTYSSGSSLPTSYSTTPIFEMSWVTTPTIVQNAVYYYEIPVNDGEYCLGSVYNHTGSYLMYLDISANAQLINRSVFTEYFQNTTSVYRYPLGVAMVVTPTTATKETVDELASSAVALEGDYHSTFAFEKSGTDITYTSTDAAFAPGFKGDAISLAWSGNSTPSLVPYETPSLSYVKQIHMIDYNASLEETTQTLITDANGTYSYTSIDAAGASTSATEYYDNAGNLITVAGSTNPTIDTGACTNSIFAFWTSYGASKDTLSFTFAAGYSQTTITFDGADFKSSTPNSYALTITSQSEALSVHITLKNGSYAITLNGTTIALGDAVAVPAASA